MKKLIPLFGLILLSTSAYAAPNCCQLWKNQSFGSGGVSNLTNDPACAVFTSQAACAGPVAVDPITLGFLEAPGSMVGIPGVPISSVAGDVGHAGIAGIKTGCFWHSEIASCNNVKVVSPCQNGKTPSLAVPSVLATLIPPKSYRCPAADPIGPLAIGPVGSAPNQCCPSADPMGFAVDNCCPAGTVQFIAATPILGAQCCPK